MIVHQPFELTGTTGQYDVRVNVLRRRHLRPSVGDSPRHHARADRRQRGVPAGAQEGRLRHARPARGRAQEVRPPQGAQAAAVLEALSLRSRRCVTRSLRNSATREQTPRIRRFGAHAATTAGKTPLWPSEFVSAEHHPVAESDHQSGEQDGGDARMAPQPPGDRHRDAARARSWRTAPPASGAGRPDSSTASMPLRVRSSMRSRSAMIAQLLGLALHLEEVVERFGDQRPGAASIGSVTMAPSVDDRTCHRVGADPAAVGPLRGGDVNDRAQVELRDRSGRWSARRASAGARRRGRCCRSRRRRGTRSRGRSGCRAARVCGSRCCSRTGTRASSRARRSRSTPACRH